MSEGTSRILAAALAVAELLAMLLAGFFAMMSVMMFDAPGSEQNNALWVAFTCAWLLPLALLIGAGFEIAAAISYSRRKMLIGLILPALPLAVLIAAMTASGI